MRPSNDIIHNFMVMIARRLSPIYMQRVLLIGSLILKFLLIYIYINKTTQSLAACFEANNLCRFCATFYLVMGVFRFYTIMLEDFQIILTRSDLLLIINNSISHEVIKARGKLFQVNGTRSCLENLFLLTKGVPRMTSNYTIASLLGGNFKATVDL